MPGEVMRSRLVQAVLVPLVVLAWFGSSQAGHRQAHDRLLLYVQGLGPKAASAGLEFVKSVLTAIVDTVVVLILSIYLVAIGPRMVEWVRRNAARGRGRRASLL